MSSSKVITLRIKQAGQTLKSQEKQLKATKEKIAKLQKELSAAKKSGGAKKAAKKKKK